VASSGDGTGVDYAWFLGAAFAGGDDDQSARFVREGVWEQGHSGRYLEDVKSIQLGDRVAMKATYTRKRGLPFDNRGHFVSVMAIKATGIVTDNLGDGRRLLVEWTPVDPPREWYFFTNMRTIWKVVSENRLSDELLRFTFEGEPQDIDSFRNRPFWADRFGDRNEDDDEPSYSVEDIIDDGCFLNQASIETILERLRDKKNLILQGPPGTGKTWLAKRLAYALIGRKSELRVRPFQFHPNLSYEEFVRGWRPEEGGGLRLVDGPFLEAVEAAAGSPDDKYVVVIEEINRGNPAQIFGEMLTLLEADKRTSFEAIALSYRRRSGERVHIPPNLYVVGTMNVADRSLALVDFALRRRFAFVDLEPTFGDKWRTWVSEQCGIEEAFLRDIETRLNKLNDSIAGDVVLGAHFRVGHSVVTPLPGVEIPDPQQWFRQVVETEITPLLGEYWFDDPRRAEAEGEKLLRGLAP